MGPQQSPLFNRALWEGNHFKILDETLLPWKVEYITVNDISEALQAVKEMKTRAFGQVLTFLYAAALVAERSGEKNPEALRERLNRLTEAFTRARPTFDFSGLGLFFSQWLRDLPSGQEVGSWIRDRGLDTAAEMLRNRKGRARRAAALFPDRCSLL